jgi:Zn-dependent protease with chaperone function/type II secretory pathway pseudopilin PulG
MSDVAAAPAANDTLIYKNEKTLFIISLTLSIIAWLLLVLGTLGMALIWLLFFGLSYLFAQSGLISHLRGTATQITPEQFPDLHQRIESCCRKLGMDEVPDAYLLHHGGAFNAFATRFLGRDFIVLYSDVVDALESEPDSLNFYIGHELGHLHRNHLRWGWVLFPASVLPLLGAAYSRAKEYTCDLYGLACCASPQVAARGLAALAAGGKRWSTLDLSRYANQSRATGGFWMSFHELIAGYPWLVKRMANILPPDPLAKIPDRSFFAWCLAIFVPHLGLAGGGGSILVVVAVIGILAAVALPAYEDYTIRTKIIPALMIGKNAEASVESYVARVHSIPKTLADAGVSAPPPDGTIRDMSIDGNGVIRIELGFPPVDGKAILLIPSLDFQKKVVWKCAPEDPTLQRYLPASCRG